MATIPIEVDLTKRPEGTPPPHVLGRQGDSDIVMRVTVLDDGAPVDFTDKYLSFAMVRRSSWVEIRQNCVQVEDNIWDCTLPAEATAYDGEFKLCYFVVHDINDVTYRQSTQGFTIMLDRSATTSAKLGNYSDTVDWLIETMDTIEASWLAEMDTQQAAYEAAETARNTQTSAAYQLAETARDGRYTTAEAARDAAFTTAEAERDSDVADAVALAGAATARANHAADVVDDLIDDDLTPLMHDWVIAQYDKAGGMVSYNTYIANVVQADGTTIVKDANNVIHVLFPATNDFINYLES